MAKIKKSQIFIILIVIAILLFLAASYFSYISMPRCVGCDKDEHGCIGSAGYSWCEPLQKCIRVWEETCTAPVACTEEAKICPDGTAVGRTGPDCEFAPCP